MTAPFDLAVDSGGDHFPVTGPTPRLSWKNAMDSRPRSYELVAVVDGAAPASVTLAAPEHRLIHWPWAPLRSAQRVSWRVRADDSDWSEWSEFEVGLCDGDWTARWISPAEAGTGAPGDRPAHTLSVGFQLDGPVRTARLYATALGVYESFVNGQRVGTTELAPGSSSYDRTLYAQAFEVTSELRGGDNRLEMVLSDGWYRGRVGAFRTPAAWGATLAARAELHLDLADGTRRIIGTDATWTSAPSVITRADLMGGQTTDRTAPTVPAVPVLVDQVDAPSISWSPAPPVRVVETRAPVATTAVGDGVWLIDFGQNASGWVSLDDLGPAGARTILEYGEFRDAEGDLSTAHLDSVRPGEPPMVFVQRDEVISSGTGEPFEPRHTVHGFQYVRVTRDAGGFDPARISMRIVHTDFARTGTFSCSAPELTRLHEIADWSFRGNAVDIPTDCPTRERLGWTGDFQIFAPTATRLYDVSGFTRKWLQSVRDDQLDDGRIANFSPDGRRVKNNTQTQFAMMTGSAGWGDAIVAVPWEMYTAYGDAAFLADNWDAMERWVEWALETARTRRHPSRVGRSAEPPAHEQYIWDGSFHWGEWIEPKPLRADGSRADPVHDDPLGWFSADRGEVGTAFLYRSTRTLADAAAVLGRDGDAAAYGDLAERIRDAWRQEFLSPEGRTTTDTQAAYVRALSFGLVPESLAPAAAARLVALIDDAGGHLATGFLSTGDLLPVLVDHGYPEVAYRVLLQPTSPSWLNMIARGATTIWEDWDGIDDEGNAHESLNHYSKGAVVRFLHTHVLGLRQAPESVGWESVIIQPTPTAALTWAEGTHDSPQGRISVAWRTDGDAITVEVDLPADTRGVVIVPDGTRAAIGPGRSRFAGRERTAVAAC
ncbi:glycoside hydrolase family 78 protein [Microbacterium sp. W1N]|uniref:alpha-L-rhamnosidase n=1 Tax=Microbacterium festucae TaxID=2977531 RepID=UPI0021C12DB7|nr:alpha-L-rhamnosidase [Microbacterium festucae]MCT9821357.1 glycoside hydrolase family 78 protein [Microbacterium festucae]